jgi:hypothetical protein
MAHRSHMNMSEFFGVDASDVFEAKEKAEGYLAGQNLADKIQALVRDDNKEKSRAFVEAVLEGLRDTI